MLWACRRPRLPRFRRAPRSPGNTRPPPTGFCEHDSRGFVESAVGARRMRVEASDLEVHRVNLLAVSLIAVGADVAVDRDLIADIHLVDQESPDLRIEGEGGQEFRPLFPLARLSVGPEFVDGDGDDGFWRFAHELTGFLRDIA